MRKLALLAVLLLVLSGASQASLFRSHLTFLPKMMADADVIANVTVESATEGKVVPLNIGVWWTSDTKQFDMVELDVKCRIHQMLKGQPTEELSFTTYRLRAKTKAVFWSGPPFPLPYFSPGQHCLVFLKQSGKGLVNPGNKWYNRIDIPPDAWKSIKPGTPEEMVKQTLIVCLEKGKDAVQSDALDWASELNDNTMLPHIKPLLHSPSTQIAHEAMITLVRMSYLPAVRMLVDEVKKGGRIKLSYAGSTGYTTMDVWGDAWELQKVKDHQAAAMIAELLDSSDDNVRSAAGEAIKGLATKDDYPLLVKMLDNASPRVRYDAHVALHKLTGLQVWPAVDLFHKDEVKYIDFWKAWARNGYSAPSQD